MKKRRNKKYQPKPTRAANTTLTAFFMLAPVSSILAQIDTEGTISTSEDGTPLYLDVEYGVWEEACPAILAILEFFEMFDRRHQAGLPLARLDQFYRFLSGGLTLPETLVEGLKRDLKILNQALVQADPTDIVDLTRQLTIKVEMDSLEDCT